MRQNIILFFTLLLALSAIGIALPPSSVFSTLVACFSTCTLALVVPNTIQQWIVVVSLVVYLTLMVRFSTQIKTSAKSMGETWWSYNTFIAVLLFVYAVCFGVANLIPNTPKYACIIAYIISFIINIFVIMQYLQSTYFITNG